MLLNLPALKFLELTCLIFFGMTAIFMFLSLVPNLHKQCFRGAASTGIIGLTLVANHLSVYMLACVCLWLIIPSEHMLARRIRGYLFGSSELANRDAFKPHN